MQSVISTSDFHLTVIKWIVVILAMICTLWLDLILPLGVAGGMPYVIVVLIAWRFKDSKKLVVAVVISTIFTFLGYLLSPEGETSASVVMINRVMALGLIWVAAILALNNLKKHLQLRSHQSLLDEHVNHLKRANEKLKIQADKLSDSEKKVIRFNQLLEKKVRMRTQDYEKAIKLYKDLYHNSPDMYASVSTKTKQVVECNETFLKTIGYERDEIIGHEYYKVYHPDCIDKRKGALDIFLAQGSVKNAELSLRHKSGKKIEVLLNVTAVRNEKGDIIESRSCWQDISELKKVERQVKDLNSELEKRIENLDMVNQELESFSYSVSHDLRSPLRTIHGFCQALEEDYAAQLPDEAKNYLGRVTAASIRMGQLIDDILALSRITRREFVLSQIDISGLAKEVGRSISEQTATEFTLNIKPNIKVKGDIGLLRIVLENLIGNSVKYAKKDTAPVIEVGMLTNNDNERVIYIKDNGVGFDMAYADKLFGAFQRLHSSKEFEGTGIGLATVQRIISRHNGKIWAESIEGVGSTFYFTLSPE